MEEATHGDFERQALIDFVRRKWLWNQHNPDAVAWAEWFAEAVPSAERD